MARNKYLVVSAGGSGVRMGADVPKQFLLLDGKPILRLTIERFVEAFPDIHVITVLPQGSIQDWRLSCIRDGFTCPQKLVAGGFTRFHSVKNALEHVPEGVLVAIHDAVRPLVSVAKIRELFEVAESSPAVIPVIPSYDTMKVIDRAEDGTLTVAPESVDRGRIWGAQTPQIFHSELLKEAYTQGFDTSFTDDASVASRYGIPVTCIQGERTNIKITTPEDLSLARLLLK